MLVFFVILKEIINILSVYKEIAILTKEVVDDRTLCMKMKERLHLI